MRTLDQLKPLTERLLEIAHLSSAASVLSWDQETYMPPGGGLARAEHLATLEGLAHDRLVSPETEALLGQWLDLASGAPHDPESWNEPARALLREVWRDFSRARKLPSAFVKRLGRETSLAQQVWTQAKAASDFRRFLPNLRTLVTLKREEAQYLGYKESPYDALLDTYEPGATVTRLRPLFDALRTRLVPLLERVRRSPTVIEGAVLGRAYDPERQMAFGRLLLTAMGYDFQRGRLDLSVHPFTTSFHPSDVRVTTRVADRDLTSCLFSCLHEGGHGLYDQGLDAAYFGTPLGESLSLSIHESQSRLWENLVGRSRPFWRCFFPLLQQTFPEQLTGVDLEQFHAAINAVKPSLIRAEADELTYNLHVMLRFEIELDVIEERLQVEELPEAWNDKMRAYLGLAPERDADGVLQDVHWSHGAFGYFPTYTLGNLYAAQFYDQARREIPDLEGVLESGRLVTLTQWLNQKIHRWGRAFTSEQLAQRVTGRPLTPEPFLAYLEQKYGELYKLEPMGKGQ